MKKTLSLVLALLLVIGLLSGCELDAPATVPTNNGSTAATAPSTAAPTTVPATEPTTEPATEPVTEPTTEPATEPTEPVTEPATEPATEPVHEHKYEKKVTEPTCTERGYTTYTCECGDSYISDVVEAKGHEYTSEVVPATCEKRGYTVYTCNACGESYKKDSTDTHPNRKVTDYGETEGTQGHYFYITFECPDCGSIYMYDFGNDYENYAEELLKYGITADPVEHVHEYEETVTPPTCENWGYTTYTCSCGYTYVVDDVEATGHDYKTTTVAPTTESEGYDLHECKNCGDSYKDNYTDKLPADDNNDNDDGNNGEIPEYKEENDCIDNGGNHSYWDFENDCLDYDLAEYHAPTCTEWGYYLFTCTKCGWVYEDSSGERPLKHDYVWVFQDDGHDTGTCNRCGHVENINPDMASIPWEALDIINARRAEAGLPAMEYASEWQYLANMRAVEVGTTGSTNRHNATPFSTLCIEAGCRGSKCVLNYPLDYIIQTSDGVVNENYTKVTFAEYNGYYVIMCSR